MFELWGATHVTNAFADLSLRSGPGPQQVDGELAELDMTFVLVGDEECGPVIAFVASPPGVVGRSASRLFACDSFRMPLLGQVTIGDERYQPGDFRFQRGRVPYENESRVNGSEGGWEMILLADRRATRVSADEANGSPDILRFEDPGGPARPSFLATTLGPIPPSGRLDGSFADQECYVPVSDHARAAYALLGDPDAGPIAVLGSTEPLQLAMPAARFETEMVRIVLSGSCHIAESTYEAGDVRVQRAGARCEPVRAGSDGLEEVIILGDRRSLRSELERLEGWAASLGNVVQELGQELDNHKLVRDVREPSGVPSS